MAYNNLTLFRAMNKKLNLLNNVLHSSRVVAIWSKNWKRKYPRGKEGKRTNKTNRLLS